MAIVPRNPGISRERVHTLGLFQGSRRGDRVKRLNRNAVKTNGAVVAHYPESPALLDRIESIVTQSYVTMVIF